MNRNFDVPGEILGVVSPEALYGVVLPDAKRVEGLLRSFGYTGRGIHELVSSAGNDLSRDVCRAARKVATIRNRLVHDDNFVMSGKEIESYRASVSFVIDELNEMQRGRLGAAVSDLSGPRKSNPVSLAGALKAGIAICVAMGVAAFVLHH